MSKNEIAMAIPKQLCPVCSIPEDFETPIINVIISEEEATIVRNLHGKIVKINEKPCSNCLSKINDNEIVMIEYYVKDNIREVTGNCFIISNNVLRFFDKNIRPTILDNRLMYCDIELVDKIRNFIKSQF